MSKTVLLGITGGIAAYKAAELVSALTKKQVEVRVIMTQNACQFIAPLTLQTLSKAPVVTDTFSRETPWEVEHIALAQRADVAVVAPATANILAKMAHGIADDMLSTTLLAVRCPVVVAPAMNVAMWEHPATQANMTMLRRRGVVQVGPEEGRLACGDVAKGHIAPVEAIVEQIMALLEPKRDLEGKTVLVTAGPTREPIDPVRYITNRSSGRMGYALARRAAERGARVVLVSGPVNIPAPEGVELVKVESTQDMLDAVLARFDACDAVIKAAAPADYRVEHPADQKLKKKAGEAVSLKLVENADIAKALGQRKTRQVLVVFAAETQNVMENARAKLAKKNADLMVANDVTQPGAGFDVDTNIVTLIPAEGEAKPLPCMSKDQVADRILDEVAAIMAQRA